MRSPLPLIALALTATLALSACGSDDPSLSAGDREKASAAALQHVGGGSVTDAERGDGDDTYAYEVEVTLPNGTDIDVELDDTFAVINSPAKASDFTESTPSSTASPSTTPSSRVPDDDRALSGSTLAKAEAAALKATGGGQVTETSGSDDADHVYEVDVLLQNGQDVTVELDQTFKVTKIDR
ncbi:PepSY domain-containing protein [Aeromicrobium sp. UC242_57]|uniref:PepSY domain-containing protein n=1 Tax=Aeromicrobium sp. UC242_57 TaxID=3374624 RepID=UPI00379E3DDE